MRANRLTSFTKHWLVCLLWTLAEGMKVSKKVNAPPDADLQRVTQVECTRLGRKRHKQDSSCKCDAGAMCKAPDFNKKRSSGDELLNALPKCTNTHCSDELGSAYWTKHNIGTSCCNRMEYAVYNMLLEEPTKFDHAYEEGQKADTGIMVLRADRGKPPIENDPTEGTNRYILDAEILNKLLTEKIESNKCEEGCLYDLPKENRDAQEDFYMAYSSVLRKLMFWGKGESNFLWRVRAASDSYEPESASDSFCETLFHVTNWKGKTLAYCDTRECINIKKERWSSMILEQCDHLCYKEGKEKCKKSLPYKCCMKVNGELPADPKINHAMRVDWTIIER